MACLDSFGQFFHMVLAVVIHCCLPLGLKYACGFTKHVSWLELTCGRDGGIFHAFSPELPQYGYSLFLSPSYLILIRYNNPNYFTTLSYPKGLSFIIHYGMKKGSHYLTSDFTPDYLVFFLNFTLDYLAFIFFLIFFILIFWFLLHTRLSRILMLLLYILQIISIFL